MEVVRVAVGEDSRRALLEALGRLKAADPLRAVIVVTPTARAAVHLRRLVATERVGPASRGVANVSFVTVDRLAETLGSDELERSGRRHLTRTALHAACRRVLSEDPGLFSSVAEHPSTVVEIVERYEELRVAGPAALEVLAGRGPAAAQLAAVARQLRRLVADRYYDDVELLESAEGAVRSDGGRSLAGDLIVYLPERLRGTEAALYRGLGELRNVLVLLGETRDDAADRRLVEFEQLLVGAGQLRTAPAATGSPQVESPAVESPAVEPRAVEPRAFDSLLLAPDPLGEVRAAVRRVLEALEAGAAPESVAILYPRSVPYAALVAGELDGVGLVWGGPAPGALAAAPSARFLASLLSMRSERIGRRTLVTLLGAAPLKEELSGGVSPGEWDRVTRYMGVTEAHIGQWRERAGEIVTGSDGPDAIDAGSDPGAGDSEGGTDDGGDTAAVEVSSSSSGREQQTRRSRAAAMALTGVLSLLDETLTRGRGLHGYSELARWALEALEDFLGGEEERAASLGTAGDADRQLVSLLVELSSLSDLDGDVGFEHFARVVLSELDRAGPRVGRTGSGVVVGPLEQALALQLKLVIVLGCAEGNLPGRVPTSALLTAADREAAGLEDRRDAEDRDRRRVLLACAAADTAVATAPRVDPRSGRVLSPSRFLAAVPSVLEVPRSERILELVSSGLSPLSAEELECALLLPHGRDGIGASSHFLTARHEGLGRGLVALERRRAESFGPYTGRVGPGVYSAPQERAVSPTSLEDYATCPFRYLVAHVLGCETLDEPEHRLTIDPRDRGTIVHEALERYLREDIAGLHEDLDEATRAGRLAGIGARVFARFERFGRTGRRVPSELERRRILRMLETERVTDEVRRSEAGARPLAVEHLFGFDPDARVPFAVGEKEVTFRGRIDRIDAVPGGLEVIDYKTGSSYGFRGLTADPVDRGRHLQLPVYALAASAAYGEREPGTVRATFRFVGRDPHDIDFVLDERGRARFAEALATILDGIDGGMFPFHPGEADGAQESNCRFCDFDALCPADRLATWQAASRSPALSRYLALADSGE